MILCSIGSNLKIPNLEPSEPPNTEPRTYRTFSLLLKSNLKPTEPPKNRTEPRTLLYTMRKNRWFFEDFPSKPNLEPTEPLFGLHKPNLEPTESPKTELNLEPNQGRPNTTLY